MKAFLIYTVLRLALFLACWGVVAGIATIIFGASTTVGVWAFVIGAVLAFGLSYPLLEGPRQRLAESIQARASRASERFEELRSSEDAED